MPYYKDADQKIYFLEDAGFSHLLPEGCVEIPEPSTPMPTLSDLKASRLLGLNRISQSLANQALSAYPEFETKTWEDQRREAAAWDADNNVDTPYIDALSGFRGLDRVEYIQRTLTKIASFTYFSTRTVGLRQKYADMIDAATDETELNAIVFDFS